MIVDPVIKPDVVSFNFNVEPKGTLSLFKLCKYAYTPKPVVAIALIVTIDFFML